MNYVIYIVTFLLSGFQFKSESVLVKFCQIKEEEGILNHPSLLTTCGPVVPLRCDLTLPST